MKPSQETCQFEKNTEVPTGDRRVLRYMLNHSKNHTVLDVRLE